MGGGQWGCTGGRRRSSDEKGVWGGVHQKRREESVLSRLQSHGRVDPRPFPIGAMQLLLRFMCASIYKYSVCEREKRGVKGG